MTGIVGRRQGGRCREMPQVAVGDFWFVGVLVVGLYFYWLLPSCSFAQALSTFVRTDKHF